MTDENSPANWAKRIYDEEVVQSGLASRALDVYVQMETADAEFDCVGWMMDRTPSASDLPGPVYNELYDMMQGTFSM